MSRRTTLGTIALTALLACALAGSAASAPLRALDPAPSLPGGGSWRLVFDDEFAGTALNLHKWAPYDSAGNGGHGLRRPSAFTINGDGQLVVTADMVDGTLVSGGMASTYNRVYGYYEIRVRTEPDPTHTLSGVVLTWPQSGRWPVDGENDIYETQDGGGHKPFRTFIHFGSDNDQYYYTHEADGSRWQTVGMLWDRHSIVVYRDGVEVWKMGDASAIPSAPQHVCIQLDAESDQALPGPVHMYVDYVRIWRRQPGRTPNP
jgi:beta-glucanase (GH16 family)